MATNNQEFIYIMVSKTNTLLGLTIQRLLGVSYNHCSIALDDSLETVYSVGRKELWNMFMAGFVVESKNSGFFAVHNNADIVLLRLPVSKEEKRKIRQAIAEYQQMPFKYSLLGLVYCYWGIPLERENRLFCSQFVAQILQRADIHLFDKPTSLVRPHDFLGVSSAEFVYTGKIGQYQTT